MFITSNEAFASYIAGLTGEGYLAIDTEFMREKSYFPRLCLLQIASSKGVALIDTLAVTDLEPLRAILADEGIVKVFHAASQDLEIFFTLFKQETKAVFDTQIAAAFIGLAGQIGYAALVQEMLDVHLSKADSFTDWARRPLDESQLSYAREDVSYLYELYPIIREKLNELGRLAWAEDEFKKASAASRFEADFPHLFLKIKKINALKPCGLAIAQGLAIWREKTAMRVNRPRKWVLADEVIIEMARRAPQTSADLKKIRAFPSFSNTQMQELIAVIKEGLARDADTLPQLEKRRKIGYEEDILADLLMIYVKDRAKRNQLVATQLALKSDIENYLADPASSNLMQGWRADILGEDFVAIASGSKGLMAGKKGLEIIEREGA